jgi:hypothetical protein
VEPDGTGGPMVGFGGKQAWLAVRAESVASVRAEMGLADLGPVPWRTGIDIAYFTDDRVMLTPALPGAADSRWILVVGRWLALPESTVDILGLSATLQTEVQYFATDRSTERHRWRRAVDGALVRSFEWLGREGELLDWRGDPDDAERQLGLPAEDPEQEPGQGELADLVVGESDVLRLAAAWSLDPTTLDGRPAPGPLSAAAPA